MKKLKRLTIIAMLLAICIVVNILESFIPIPIPGVKLGLANVIILIMLYEFKVSEAFMVNILRIILVGMMRGNIFSPTFLMSLSGGILSFVVMLIFSRISIFSIIGVSVLGSISHATGQVIMAIIILSTEAVIYYLPFIGILSIITGIFSGVLVKTYLTRSVTKNILDSSIK